MQSSRRASPLIWNTVISPGPHQLGGALFSAIVIQDLDLAVRLFHHSDPYRIQEVRVDGHIFEGIHVDGGATWNHMMS